MIVSIIAAHDPNLLIGSQGGLPWRYPEDLKHFKKHTIGKTVLMGRGVFEELNEIPLPGRKNIVLSTSRNYQNVPTYKSLSEALENIEADEVFVIGGGEVYRQTMPMADKMIITEIKNEYDGDTYFPEYRDLIGKIWIEVKREDKGDLSFVEYKRS